MSLHASGNPKYFGNELYPEADHTVTWWVYMWAAEDVKLGFTTFFQGGVFERFPGFKLVVTESGSGWLPHWLERMDEYYEIFGFTTGMKMKPTDYFKRQCWIDMEPEERKPTAQSSSSAPTNSSGRETSPTATAAPTP